MPDGLAVVFVVRHQGCALAARVDEDKLALHQRRARSAKEEVRRLGLLQGIDLPDLLAARGSKAREQPGDAKSVDFAGVYRRRRPRSVAEKALEIAPIIAL